MSSLRSCILFRNHIAPFGYVRMRERPKLPGKVRFLAAFSHEVNGGRGGKNWDIVSSFVDQHEEISIQRQTHVFMLLCPDPVHIVVSEERQGRHSEHIGPRHGEDYMLHFAIESVRQFCYL